MNKPVFLHPHVPVYTVILDTVNTASWYFRPPRLCEKPARSRKKCDFNHFILHYSFFGFLLQTTLTFMFFPFSFFMRPYIWEKNERYLKCADSVSARMFRICLNPLFRALFKTIFLMLQCSRH